MASLPLTDENFRPPDPRLDLAGPDETVRRVTGGAVWVLLAFGAYRLLSAITNLILARLLSPGEFGLVSFAMVAVGAFTLLQDLGVSAAVVYSDRFDRKVLGTALTLTFATSVALFGLIVAGAPFVATLGGEPQVRPVLVALGAGLVISAFGSVHSALLVKMLATRRKFWADVVPYAVSGAVAVGLAVAGFGVWSLVTGHLAKTAATTVLLWVLTPVRPRPGFDRGVALDLLRYGRHIALTAVIGFVSMNSDYFLVGHLLGPRDLGLYTLAFMLATLVPRAVSELAAKVSFPALSSLRHDPTTTFNLFATSMLVVSVFAVLVALSIWVLGPALIPAILGEKWAPMVPALRVLGLFGALQCLTYNFPAIFKATGRPDILWKFSLARLLVPVPFMVVAIRLGYGIVGVAFVHLAAEVCLLPAFSAALARVAGRPVFSFWRPVTPVFFAGLPVVLIAVSGPEFIAGLGGLARTVAGAVGFLAILVAGYAGLLTVFNPGLIGLGRRAALSVLKGTDDGSRA